MSTVSQPHATAPLERFLTHCHRRRFPRNAVIISAGDVSNDLYCLTAGSVTVLIEDDRGHEMVLAYLNPGDFFGEIGLFDEKRMRSAWVRARSDCEIAQIGYGRLMELARNEPEIMFALLGQLSLRIRDTSRKARDLALKDVSGRVARALIDLATQPDAQPAHDGVMVRVTRQELGRIVGCSREMVSRVLGGLEEQGIISSVGRALVVHDPAVVRSTAARARRG
ncbi:MAG: cAMP-activated global transcriptional regulator CRP [Ectothiorhodospiraceae bacterium]|nr:cAMP-activated global transcriptional regulator CRP [Ectothiorhodospiraceae bacterium]